MKFNLKFSIESLKKEFQFQSTNTAQDIAILIEALEKSLKDSHRINDLLYHGLIVPSHYDEQNRQWIYSNQSCDTREDIDLELNKIKNESSPS